MSGAGAALTPELASRVGFWQERHAVGGAEPPSRTGVVVGVRAAFGRFAARGGDGSALSPEPGSVVLVDLERVGGVESVPTGERLNGYVVELELEAAVGDVRAGVHKRCPIRPGVLLVAHQFERWRDGRWDGGAAGRAPAAAPRRPEPGG